MKRKILWLVVSGLMTLSLVMAACGPAATPTAPTTPSTPTTPTSPTIPTKPVEEKTQKEAVAPAAEVPKYGATLNALGGEVGTGYLSGGRPEYTHQSLWAGDWAKGSAGGYGTNEDAYNWSYPDIWAYKAGYIAESVKWIVNAEKNEGTIIYQVRRGIHWALNPNSEASRLVGGRELTADDVIFTLTTETTDPKANLYRRNPELRAAKITKTGPWEVSVKIPLKDLVIGIMRLSDDAQIAPPELMKKYGDMSNWKNSVGTGPFVLTDYVPGSVLSLIRNLNYWGKDPVGPGKGNQLPYLDGIRQLIIPDKSTQQAALRTGKIDQMSGVMPEDSTLFRQTTPALLTHDETYGVSISGTPSPTRMRTDKAPFNDIRVRRAMMMAINFETINQALAGGRGQILSSPYRYVDSYKALYLTLSDQDIPASVRELYTYNPDKAKQLLKEAGYPNGFKTHILLPAAQVDYYSIYKDMWAKVGIDLELRVMESGALNSIANQRSHEAMIVAGGQGPPSIFWAPTTLQGESATNTSMINDPAINEGLAKIRLTIVTEKDGYAKGMNLARELNKYVLDQAYIIPTPGIDATTLWWPWLKNYSGEISVGYGDAGNWAQWVWIDQALKKSMGY